MAPPLSLIPNVRAFWVGMTGLAGMPPRGRLWPERPYQSAAMACVQAGLALQGSGPAAAMRQDGVGAPVVWPHLLRPSVPSWGGTGTSARAHLAVQGQEGYMNWTPVFPGAGGCVHRRKLCPFSWCEDGRDLGFLCLLGGDASRRCCPQDGARPRCCRGQPFLLLGPDNSGASDVASLLAPPCCNRLWRATCGVGACAPGDHGR